MAKGLRSKVRKHWATERRKALGKTGNKTRIHRVSLRLLLSSYVIHMLYASLSPDNLIQKKVLLWYYEAEQ